MANLEAILDSSYELTEEHFKFFCEEFTYWINRYSLNNWEFHYYFEDDTGPESDQARARLVNDHESRIALVFLNKVWVGTEPNEINVKQAAYHEVCELLLSKLNDMIRRRNISEREIEEEIHTVVRTLENAHFYNRE